MPKRGIPLATASLITATRPLFSSSAMAAGKAPTPGKIKPEAATIFCGSADSSALTPSLSKARRTLAVLPAS